MGPSNKNRVLKTTRTYKNLNNPTKLKHTKRVKSIVKIVTWEQHVLSPFTNKTTNTINNNTNNRGVYKLVALLLLTTLLSDSILGMETDVTNDALVELVTSCNLNGTTKNNYDSLMWGYILRD